MRLPLVSGSTLKRPLLLIRLVAVVMLLILLSPAPIMVAYSNPDEGIILGRYTVLYFTLLVAYVALALLWTVFTVWLWVIFDAPRLKRWRQWAITHRGLVLAGFAVLSIALFVFAYTVQERVIPLPHGMLWRLEVVPLLIYPPACLGVGSAFGSAFRGAGKFGEDGWGFSVRLPGWSRLLSLAVGVVGWVLLWTMALRGAPWLGPGLFGTAIVLVVLVIVPGVLIDRVLGLPRRLPAAGRLALWFVLGLTALQAISLAVRLAGLHVSYALITLAGGEAFLLAVLILKYLTREEPPTSPLEFQIDISTLMYVIAAVLSVAGVIWATWKLANFVYEASADVWAYSEYVTWFVEHPGKAMVSRNALLGGVDFRYRTNGWLLANAAMAWVQGVAPAQQITITLPVVLPLIGMSAVLFFAYQVSDRSLRVALLAVVVTALSYLLAIIIADGAALHSNGAAAFFLTRLSEDKSVALFIFEPVLLGLLYTCVREQKSGVLIAVFALASLGIVFTHPLGILAVAAGVGGFGVLHVIVAPRQARLGVFAALIAIVLPLTLVSFVQSGELSMPAVEQAVLSGLERPVDLIPARGAAIDIRGIDFSQRPQSAGGEDSSSGDSSGSDGSQDQGLDLRDTVPLQALGYTPLLAVAVAMAVLLAVLRWRELSIQLISGSTLLLVIVLYAPSTAQVISKMASSRALQTAWRFLWVIPVGTIFALALQQVAALALLAQTPLPGWQRAARTAVAWACLAEVIAVLALLPTPLDAQVVRDSQYVVDAGGWDLLAELDALDTEDNLIFAPRNVSGLITGFGQGHVLSPKTPEKFVGQDRAALEWAEAFFAEDDPGVLAEQSATLSQLVDQAAITVIVLPRNHPFNAQLRDAPPFPAVPAVETEDYIIYWVGRAVSSS